MGWDDVGGFDALSELVPGRTRGKAAGVAVLVLPPIGWSRSVQAVLVVLVWTVALVYRGRVRALGDRPRPVDDLVA